MRMLNYVGCCVALWFMIGVNTSLEAQEIYAGKFAQQTGEALYQGICQGCHMPDAKGAIGAGAYPALANNPRLAVAIYPIVVVLNGQRAMPALGKGAPPFSVGLTDVQVANVLNYVRTHFGNHYQDVITPAAVGAARTQSQAPGPGTQAPDQTLRSH
jgi:mono/diheme cytochrome c family protein